MSIGVYNCLPSDRKKGRGMVKAILALFLSIILMILVAIIDSLRKLGINVVTLPDPARISQGFPKRLRMRRLVSLVGNFPQGSIIPHKGTRKQKTSIVCQSSVKTINHYQPSSPQKIIKIRPLKPCLSLSNKATSIG